MALWLDKYRPSSLDNMDHQVEADNGLRSLAKTNEIPHLLFHGPSGSGKTTRISILLKMIYGDSVNRTINTKRVFEMPSGKLVEMCLTSSLYHIEISPGDAGFYDKVVVQTLIREIAQSKQVNINSLRPFKTIIINEAEGLSREAQHALRRTMEKYISNLRIFFVCNDLERIIQPIQSRCVMIRIPAPDNEILGRILLKILESEKVVPQQDLVTKIAEYSRGNLRKALLSLEATSNTLKLERTDWEEFIEDIATSIIKEQTPSQLLEIRSKFYELLVRCVPATIIFKTLCNTLISLVEYPLDLEIIREAALYEHRTRNGIKSIFHLEAFVAKCMALYKNYIVGMDVDV